MFECELRSTLRNLMEEAGLQVHDTDDGRLAWGLEGKTWGVLHPSGAAADALAVAARRGGGSLLFELVYLSTEAMEHGPSRLQRLFVPPIPL